MVLIRTQYKLYYSENKCLWLERPDFTAFSRYQKYSLLNIVQTMAACSTL